MSDKNEKKEFNELWLCIAFPNRDGEEGYQSADFRYLEKDSQQNREFKERQVEMIRQFAEDPGKIEVKEANGKLRFVLKTGAGMERSAQWIRENKPNESDTSKRRF